MNSKPAPHKTCPEWPVVSMAEPNRRIGPCRRAPHELSANSRLISAGQFGAGSFLRNLS